MGGRGFHIPLEELRLFGRSWFEFCVVVCRRIDRGGDGSRVVGQWTTRRAVVLPELI